MIAFLSLIICVVGGMVYCLTDRKGAELGRLAFGIGLVVFLWQAGPKIISLLGNVNP